MEEVKMKVQELSDRCTFEDLSIATSTAVKYA